MRQAPNKPAKRLLFAPWHDAATPSIQTIPKPGLHRAPEAGGLPESEMNVTLKPFDFAQAVARAGLQTNGQPVKRNGPVEGPGFSQALSQALKGVSADQQRTAQMQRDLQTGNSTVSIEETMVAMQKAQIGFQATLQTRNKLVQAYSDIMNMQV